MDICHNQTALSRVQTYVCHSETVHTGPILCEVQQLQYGCTKKRHQKMFSIISKIEPTSRHNLQITKSLRKFIYNF